MTGLGVEQFETPRLVGRRLLPADFGFLTELHNSDAVMATHGGPRSAAATEPFVKSNVAHWRHYHFGLYVLSWRERPTEPIGRAGLRLDRDDEGHAAADLSIVLSVAVWGRGIGKEVVGALVAIAHYLDLPIVARSEADNGRARAVMDHVGLVHIEDYRRNGVAWCRYQWPDDAAAPVTVAVAAEEQPR